MGWLSTIAPTIASALGGPLAGLAVEAVSKAIGIDPKDVAKTIADGKLSADQIAQIKVAEIEMAAREQELGLDFAKLAVDDRKSARDMQSNNNSFIPGLMALVVTVGFFGILIGLMTEHFKTSVRLFYSCWEAWAQRGLGSSLFTLAVPLAVGPRMSFSINRAQPDEHHRAVIP